MPQALERLIGDELSVAVDPRVADFAASIAARHGAASRAVLFYGSCLREKQLDGLMLDFYLIVSDYGSAFDRKWLATANRLIPPNVFPAEHGGLAAKYAVLSESDFHRLCGPSATEPSVLARFAQPSRLVWSADPAAAATAMKAVGQAAPTLLGWTLPTVAANDRDDPLVVWKAAFALTYGAEMRAERGSRPGAIVDADPDRYRRVWEASQPLPLLLKNGDAARKAWRARQRRGKRTQAMRLAKATATFAGGIDYIAWKINRHAGTNIVIKPWQRRHPLIAAIGLLPRLLRSGAVR